ncbi:carbohydrate kinase family protein [Streptomyces sp. NBC_01261]|uniref:carbohydrate kinase family protein n=1 Tax=unclassified Streptomyces TaxID=2593676 RepID=UPI002E2B93DF|nr:MULTISPECIES: carbohydrate kinase family protein [unclassified Streptomyces]
MRIAVTGSIATDHLMVFQGRFTDQLLTGSLEKVSLSFLAEELEIRRGGVAANIAVGLGRLGLTPLLVGAAGSDFADYQLWLKQNGVDTDSVTVSTTRHTARFVSTTDSEQNQIATFYTGAMSEAREIGLRPLIGRVGRLDMVVVAPNDPAAMLRHTQECIALGIPFAADPSQQLAHLGRSDARELLDHPQLLFTNEYESSLLQERTGWTEQQVLGRTDVWVTTLGADGVRIRRAGRRPVTVPAVTGVPVADPTGVGDAFRAGFLAGRAWHTSAERAAQLGCALATFALETVGTQEYTLDRTTLLERVRRAYGPDAEDDLAVHLPADGEDAAHGSAAGDGG